MHKLELEQIITDEAIVINKQEDVSEIVVNVVRNVVQHEEEDDRYQAKVAVELYLSTEESIDILARSFCVRISVHGCFRNTNPESISVTDDIHECMINEVEVFARTNMATLMACCGIPPYFFQ